MSKNPLPGFRDDCVRRYRRGKKLFIKPILPTPDELYAFCTEALRCGFKPGPECIWGNSEWAPRYYFKTLRRKE